MICCNCPNAERMVNGAWYAIKCKILNRRVAGGNFCEIEEEKRIEREKQKQIEYQKLVEQEKERRRLLRLNERDYSTSIEVTARFWGDFCSDDCRFSDFEKGRCVLFGENNFFERCDACKKAFGNVGEPPERYRTVKIGDWDKTTEETEK